jgi:glucose/arabinose dehydrogenase
MAITGDGAANLLRGTATSNEILGLGGNDTVRAWFGADTVSGGAGNDDIWGGDGADKLYGNSGNDVIFGYNTDDRNLGSGDITLTRVTPVTLERPVFATSAPGDPNKLYVIEQHTGQIEIVNTVNGAVAAEPFLDLPAGDISTGNEQGLLGFAFDPDYATNRKFYVYLTNADGDVEVRSYLRSATDATKADPGSGNVILTIDKDNGEGNHNGGWMGFGPDGYLYISVGDEGGAGDASNNAQNKDVLWGKMLRIDINGDDFPGNPNRDYAIPDDNPFVGVAGLDEIWAYGLRNPWRSSFDKLTGDLYIGDVGQGEREEINFEKAGGAGGVNYGWKVKEGRIVFDDSVPGNPPANSPLLTDPVVNYAHDPATGGFSVTGGYVYRGTEGGMKGRYLYADFVTDKLWSFKIVGGKAVDVTNHTEQVLLKDGATLQDIASFAEDGNGNLYIVGLNGVISKLSFGTASGDGADLIDGGAGSDRLFGGAGRDTVYGGTENDTVHGGSQADILRGNEGNDQVFGSAGNDQITGGEGADTVTGGGGRDTFYFGLTSASDRIADFQNDIDTIRIGDGYGFATASQALGFADQVGGNVVFTFNGGQVLTVVGTTLAELPNDLLV